MVFLLSVSNTGWNLNEDLDLPSILRALSFFGFANIDPVTDKEGFVLFPTTPLFLLSLLVIVSRRVPTYNTYTPPLIRYY